HPPVPLCSVTHLCHSTVSHTCAQKCHLPVPRSATYLCPEVPPTCAHPPVPPTCAARQCCQSAPSSCASQRRQSVPSSDASQCRLSVPIISVTSLVLSISAAYPCHLISTAYQCPL
ncbi:unnamed protein product, partial [Staurois parvus]